MAGAAGRSVPEAGQSQRGSESRSSPSGPVLLQQLRPRILELGFTSEEVLDEASRLLDAPWLFDFAFASVAGWGRLL